jgi:hypothetical protein
MCFLSIRLLLARVTLRSAVLEGDSSLGRDRISQLRSASSAVLDFILSLGESQFQDFWLPYVTHLLVHAITVSLRCTVETQDTDIRNTSVARLQRVIAHIQFARDNYDWDIAIYCLERCADPVSRIAALNAREPQLVMAPPLLVPTSETDAAAVTATAASLVGGSAGAVGAAAGAGHSGNFSATSAAEMPQAAQFEDPNFLLSDVLDPNAFDFSWEALWDTPSGMTNFSI